MSEPITSQDPLYLLLSNEDVAGFNAARERGQECNLRGCNFRGLDLRGMNAEGLDLRDAYFRNANLRGIDFRRTLLEGASLADAQVSGCFFPRNIAADEIVMSVIQGTRMRTILKQ